MRVSCIVLMLFSAGCFPSAGEGQAGPDIHDTRLLSQPAVSAGQVAFIYDNDLWVADLDGRNVRRLTSDAGLESNPVFSPDGTTIAFSAQYDGNTDVYVVPATGGRPTRLTWHPGADTVRGFTPDSGAVLFTSPRHVFTLRYTQFFTVPIAGGMPSQLAIPHGAQASFSPDGTRIAYTPLADRTQQWKGYRGGTHSRIWIYCCKDHHVDSIPQPAERVNDVDPQWVGRTIYFRSDRDGEYNLYAYDTQTQLVKRLTQYKDFPVVSVASGGGRVVYEQAGYLHLFDPAKESIARLKIGVASDLVEMRPRTLKGTPKYVRDAAISPHGARAVFEYRGEIVTVPAEKGDPRNLTESPGANDRSPRWSPDGKSIAWFSDEGGEYRLHIRPADGKGGARIYALGGAGFYFNPAWSPDSQKIAYLDNSETLFWIDLQSGRIAKVAEEPVYLPAERCTLRPAWSPDSNWIAYALGNRAAYRTVYVYNVASRESRPITDGMSDAIDPVFDAGGQYLYFMASTDAGPANNWFAQSAEDMRFQRSIYAAVLRRGVASPFARESDEEKTAEREKEPPKSQDVEKKDVEKKPDPVAIDFEGIQHRIVALPEAASNYTHLQAGPPGRIFYLDWSNAFNQTLAASKLDAARTATLKRFDLEKRKSETILSGLTRYSLAASGKKALVFAPPETWSLVDMESGSPALDKGKLKIEAVEVRTDPSAEWPAMFEEAWRVNRDYFYDPNMHGADWPAVRKKYAEFLPHAATRSDLCRIIRWMLSELAVGHSYLFPGELPDKPKPVPGGLLGADYEVANGRYRFKKVYGGLNWNPDLRSPLTAPKVEVKAGEYLLAVRGIDLRPPMELYSLFENTADKSLEITVGPSPDGQGSRTVTVEPLASEYALRNRDWVEGNLRRVHEATGGRVAYVYVPDTSTRGHEYFKRYFYPQCDKQAIILDERFNGGGQVADYYIDHLRRPFIAMWATRYGEDLREPGAAILGPKVMLIDETAGSGGDLLPWMFRKLKMGPIIGKRTWGGLVGILEEHTLIDGTRVTAPNIAIWAEGGWVVENEGVPPDLDVEQRPADVIAGRDPQLEKAIEVVLDQLAKQPLPKLKRPEYPRRARP